MRPVPSIVMACVCMVARLLWVVASDCTDEPGGAARVQGGAGGYGMTPSGTSGSERNRTPVAAKIALASAGAIAMMGVSPPPAEGRSRRSTSTTSMGGTSPVSYTHLRAHETRHD